MTFSDLYSAIVYRLSPKRFYYPNVLKSQHQKRVAISYLTLPFVSLVSTKHSNSQEALKIAEVFDRSGFVVDVFDANAPVEKLPGLAKKYDLVFGIEPNFIFLAKKYPKAKKIYYATGAFSDFQNRAETQRLLALKKRKGKMLARRRVVSDHNSSFLADSVISIGNRWTKSTYKSHAKKVQSVHVSAYSFFPFEQIAKAKNWRAARKNFLWFGSVGAVHKGLDLLLEIFSKRRNLQLYICGAVNKETDFVELYHKELFNLPNIHFIGWIDPNSAKFENIIKKCAFTILPSCSEGMSSSVATCMQAGLIPLVSKESGIDVGSAGVIFKNNSITEIEKVILAISKQSATEIKKLSVASAKLAKENFSLSHFEKDFKQAINKLL